MSDYYTRSFSSFSGADIRASFAGIEIGTLQAVSYAVQREKAPIYVLGRPNPRAFSRGKRGIAGTMVFVMFDDHALLSAFENEAEDLMKFVKDKKEITPDIVGDPDAEEVETDGTWRDYELTKAFYVDQIPPFDVTISGVNEMAAAATLRIWGVELLNEGYGISVDDMVSEMQMTYVARAISRWRKAGTPAGGDGGVGAVESFPFEATRSGGGIKFESA